LPRKRGDSMPEDGRFSDGLAQVRLQRATGRAEVTLAHRRGATRIAGLHQSGSAKAFLPDMHGATPEVIFLNTAGGLTGGDSLRFALTLGPGTQAVGTTQTAERAYASRHQPVAAPALMDVSLDLGAQAVLDWLPQETILFERSTLSRRTSAQLGAGARLLLAEIVVLGRAAMGETVRHLRFTDWREVRRAGQPVLIEPLRITDETLCRGPAGLNAARAVASLALIAPGAEDALARVRSLLPDGAAASAWDGRLVVRLTGPDLAPVKQAVARVVTELRGADLPRVWQM
jgi:urease accessory protein